MALLQGGTTVFGTGTIQGILYVGGIVTTATIQSTSTFSGSIVVSGGIGLSGNINAGGVVTATNLYVGIWPVSTGTTSGSSNITGTNNSFLITNQTQSVSTTTGALVVSGGVGISGNLYVYGGITATQLTIAYTTITQSLITSPDIFTITNTTPTTSPTTGALVVSGGAGVGGGLFVGGVATATNLYVGIWPVSTGTTSGSSNITGTNNSFLITNTTPTTSPTTGALVVSGGAGVGGGLFVGGVSSFIGIISTGLSTFTNTLEILSNVGSVSGATTLSYTSGQTYYVTPSATWSIAFTNVPTNPANYSTILTVVVNQGSTAYTATSITINGSAVTPKWSNGTPWSGNANHTDVVSYGVLNLAGTFNVVAQYSTFA